MDNSGSTFRPEGLTGSQVPKNVSIQEAAKTLGISQDQVRELVKTEVLHEVSPGVFNTQEVANILASRGATLTQEASMVGSGLQRALSTAFTVVRGIVTTAFAGAVIFTTAVAGIAVAYTYFPNQVANYINAKNPNFLQALLQPEGQIALGILKFAQPTVYNQITYNTIGAASDIFSVQNGKIYPSKPLAISSGSVLSVLTTAQIANLNASFLQGKVPGTTGGDLAIIGQVTGLADNSVSTNDIQDGAVTGVKIANGAVGDSQVSSLTASNKVLGSAVQLNGNGGLTNNSGLSLLTTCSDSQILKWNATASAWECQADQGSSGSGITSIREGGTTVVSSATAINFTASDFNVSESPATVGNISIDYPNSGITRSGQNQTITGTWTFPSGTVVGTDTFTTNNIVDSGPLTIKTTTSSALTLDSGTTGSVSLGTGAFSKTVSVGSSTGTSTLNLAAGTGGVGITGATTFNSTPITLTAGSTVIDMTGTGILGINTTTNRAITTGTGLFTAGGALTATGALTSNTSLTASGNLATPKGTDYPTTGSQNNVNLGNGSLFRYTGVASATFTGISGGTDGRLIRIANASSNNLTLTNLDGSSTASNQIVTSLGGNLVVGAGSAVTLAYDAGSSLWRVIGYTPSSSTLSTVAFVQNGNGFGTTAVLGTTDANPLDLITSATTRFALDSAASTLTGQGATTLTSTGALTLSSGAGSALTIDSGTTGAIQIGTDSSNETINIGGLATTGIKQITLGSTIGNSTSTIVSGTGGIGIGDQASTKTIRIGGNLFDGTDTVRIATNGTSPDTINIGNNNASTVTTITGGTAWSINSSGVLTTTGNISTTGSGTITSAGAFSGPTSTNTINGLVINSSALSNITTLNMSGQLTSTLATGTAPFVVASTTNVANLNASSLNGATFASPGTIGGGTPGSATFTTLTANTSVTDAGLTTNGVVTNTSAGLLGTLAGTTTTVLHGNAAGLPTFASVTGSDLASNITISTTGNISTTGTGTITSAGLLTASNGFTQTTGALNLTGTSGALTLSGLGASSVNLGSNNILFTSGNLNTTATGINSTAIGATNPSTGKFTTLTSTGATDLANAGASNVTIATTGTGTVTIGNATGTFQLISSGGLNVSTGGALTGVASLDTITTSPTALTFAGAGTISSTGTNSITLDSGTTGAVNIGNSANAKTVTVGNTTGATAVNINSGTGGVNFTLGPTSSSTNLTIGNSATATPDLLVLDNGTADPTGTNGASYYNTGTNKFRCFEGGGWKDCDTTGGTTTLQSAYNAGQTITLATGKPLSITGGDATDTVGITPAGVLTLTSGGAATWGTTAGNLTLQVAGTGTTANVQIGAGGGGSTTPDLLVVDQDTTTLPTGTNGAILLDSTGKFNIFEGGAWKVLCNKTDQSCGTGSGSALSAITAATTGNTINSGDNAQVWNWDLTTAAKTAFSFGENVASTNGAGSQYILGVSTLATSTAAPLNVSARGNKIIDTSNAGALTFGNTTLNTPITLQSGTGAIGIGTDANAKAITIGTSTGGTTLALTGGATWSISTAGTLTTSGNISTTSTGTITSAGLLTASNGFTQTTGATNITGTSGALTLSGLGASSINSGVNDITFTSGHFNTTATGINSTAVGATTPSTGAFTTLSGSTSITDGGLSTNGVVTNTAAGLLGTLAGTTTTVLHGNASGLPTFASVTGSDLASNITISTTGNISTTGTGTITSAGAITGPTSTNTINGLIINSGALSGITTVNMSGQLTSTLATGTAPFVVASTTNVANLNASSLNGATFASPGNIGTGTPGTGKFTSLTSTGATDLANAGASNVTIATTGTGTVAIGNSTGTFALTSSGGLNVTTGGALTGVASLDTISTSATTLTFAGTGTLDTTAAALNLGTSGATSLSVGKSGVTTTNNGALTSTQTLTASNGFTVTTGALSFNTTSGTLSATGLTALTQTLTSGTAAITAPTLNLNTASTGTVGIGNGTGAVTFNSPTINLAGASTIIDLTGGGTLGLDTTSNAPITTGTGLLTATGGLTIGATGNFSTLKGADYTTTGVQDNVVLGGGSGVLFRYNGAGTATFSGIANGSNGRLIRIVNVSASNLTIANNGSGTAANNVVTGTGANVVLTQNQAITLQYDSTASVWRTQASTASVTGNFFVQGGNAFAATATLGTTDANLLNIITAGATRFSFDSATSTFTGQGASTISSTGTLSVTSAAANNLNVTSGTTGAVTVDSGSTGNVNLGTGSSAKTIAVGGSGANTVQIGNAQTAGSISLGNAMTTGTITIGGTGQTGTITLGSSSGTNIVAIGDGAGATTVNIANNQLGGAVSIGAAMTTGTIQIGNPSGAQTGTITIGGGTGAQTVNLATGGTGVKTVHIADGTAANVITLGTGQLGGSIALGSSMTTGTIDIGNSSNAMTGTINIGGSTGAQSLNFGGGNTGIKTIAIGGGTAANVITIANNQTGGSFAVGNAMTNGTITLGGTSTTGTITLGQSTAGNTITIGSGNLTAATQTINIGNGTSTTSGGEAINIGNGTPGTGTTNTIAIGTQGTTTGTVGITIGSVGNAAHTTLIQGGSGNAITLTPQTTGLILIGGSAGTGNITLGSSSATQSVLIGNGAGAGSVSIANVQNGGSVNIGTAMTTGTITLGGSSMTGTLALNTGTGVQQFTSAVATGTTTTSAFVFNAGSLTSGTALRLTSSSTSGLLFDQNATNTSGTIDKIAYGASKTLAGALTGLNLDLSTNLTATGQSLTGMSFSLATDTNIANATKTGISITQNAITQNTAANTGTVLGQDITMGALTLTTGTALNSIGLRITTGNLTQTAGALDEDGIKIDSTNTTFTTGGTLDGLHIQAPTTIPSVGTYNNIFLGTSASASANLTDQATIAIGNIASTATNNFSTLNITNGGTGFLDVELVHGFINMQGMNTFKDDFTGRALDTTNTWTSTATGGGTACAILAGGVGGLFRETTGGAANRGCELTTQVITTLTNGAYQRGNNPIFETRVRIDTPTNARIQAGFTDTRVAVGSDTLTGTASNHAYLQKTAAGTTWQCVTGDGTTTESTVDTGVTVLANTFYRLRVEVRNGTTPETICTVDDGSKVLKTANTAHQPSTASPMDVYVRDNQSDTVVKNMDVDYVRTWQDDPIVSGLTINQVGDQTAADTSTPSASIALASPTGTPVASESGTLNDQVTSIITNLFNNLIEFFGNVIFHQNVSFLAHVLFGADSAGHTIIKAGDSEADINFSLPYKNSPVVSLNVYLTGSATIDQIPAYAIYDNTTGGFKIKLVRPAPFDIDFGWTAVEASGEVSGVQTSAVAPSSASPAATSAPESLPTPTPTPEATLAPTPTETPTATPAGTPVVSPTPSPTATATPVSPAATPTPP